MQQATFLLSKLEQRPTISDNFNNYLLKKVAMFRKRKKKYFPPGTFIPTSARIMAILQMCIAFSMFLWIVSQPFMGDLFTIKSQLIFYETVMGKKELPAAGQMQRNAERFMELPASAKNQLEAGYSSLKKEMQKPFLKKLQRSAELLLTKTPPFELAWIFFSILIPILLLIRIEGAVPAVWLLVLMTLGYGADNQLNAPSRGNREAHLFPTESELLHRYIKEPLKSNIFDQEGQLRKGWELFLIDQWAKEPVAKNLAQFAMQVEKGEFSFNIARIHAMKQITQALSINTSPEKHSLLTLALYMGWNTLMASVVTRTCGRKKTPSRASCKHST